MIEKDRDRVPWVKVCGLTRSHDVAAAVDAGADALGFVLDVNSPRHVDLPLAARLIGDVPIITVLVTVDMPVDQAVESLECTSATGIQPYGAHAGEVAQVAVDRGLTVLRPGHASDRPGIQAIPELQIPLLDTPDTAVHGGTGRVFDWSATDGIDREFVLAGGLGPGNVGAAVRRVRPWGVDASSGLESAPGKKDAGKVLAYVEEAKRW